MTDIVERAVANGYGNESARLATEAAGEPSEWDIYTKQMVEIAEYADWEIRDCRRDLEAKDAKIKALTEALKQIDRMCGACGPMAEWEVRNVQAAARAALAGTEG